MVPCAALNGRHPNTAQCTKGEEWKRCRLATEEMRNITEWDLRAYVLPFNLVTSFKYLVLTITGSDNDWPAVVGNLWKARTKWDRMASILRWEESNKRV